MLVAVEARVFPVPALLPPPEGTLEHILYPDGHPASFQGEVVATVAPGSMLSWCTDLVETEEDAWASCAEMTPSIIDAVQRMFRDLLREFRQ